MRIIDYPAPARALDGSEAVPAWQDGHQVAIPAATLVESAVAPQVLAAEEAAETAQLAAATAQAASRYFASRAAGELASGIDQGFSTDDGAGNLIAYRRIAGGSVEIARMVTPAALAAATGAGLIGYGQRTAAAKFDEQRSILDDGAAGDGVTDDGPVIASRALPIVFPRQIYHVATDTVVDVTMECRPGTQFLIQDGVTLTARAGFEGAYETIFTGGGSVDLLKARLKDDGRALAEWWAAKRDDNTVDCVTPITKAIDAARKIRLLSGTYFTSDTLVMAQDYFDVLGAGKSDEYTDKIPNLADLVTSSITLSDTLTSAANAASKDVMVVGRGGGFSGVPAPDAWTQAGVLRGLSLRRTKPPAGAAQGLESQGAAGLRTAFIKHLEMDAIFSVDHNIGFDLGATVYCKLGWLHALRTVNGPSDALDYNMGFLFDGNYRLGPYAGSNASIMFKKLKSAVTVSGSRPEWYNFAWIGAFADTFGDQIESYGSPKRGAVIKGAASNTDTSRRKIANGDFKLNRVIVDNAGEVCLEITNTTAWSSLTIGDVYLLMAGANDQTSLYVHDTRGLVSITSGEIRGEQNSANGGSARGIYAVNAQGLTVSDAVHVIGFNRPVVLDGSSVNRIMATINNPAELTRSTQYPDAGAVYLTNGSNKNTIGSPMIVTPDGNEQAAGSPGAGATPPNFKPFNVGVLIDASCTGNTIHARGIDKDRCSSGYRVAYAANVVTAAGVVGNDNLVDAV